MKHSVKDLLEWLIRDAEMRKRLIFTVGVIALLKLAVMIPVPGIDHSSMQMFLGSFGRRMSPLSHYGVWVDGPFNRVSIFALGMMPFLSACLLLQLASIVIPPLRNRLLNGENGRNQIVRYTFVLTLLIAIIQSWMLSSVIQHPNYFSGIAMVPEPGFGFQITCVLTMTAAVALMVFLAEMINRRGIGNGYAWLIISPVFYNFALYCWRFYLAMSDSEAVRRVSIPSCFVIGLLAAALVYGTWYVYNKRTAVKLSRNNTETDTIHFRPTIVGREPISFAKIALMIPVVDAIFDKIYLVYILYFVGAIFALTFLYSWIVSDPTRLAGKIKQFGFSVESEFLKKSMKENLKIAALFLIGAFVLPDLVEELVAKLQFGGKTSVAMHLIPHFSIILFTAVILDTLSQLEFFKSKQDTQGKDWGVCYTAFTETEAEVKTHYLQSHGIKSLTEPLRFSWGVPTRTMIDQYRIYTPADKTTQARDLILKAESSAV